MWKTCNSKKLVFSLENKITKHEKMKNLELLQEQAQSAEFMINENETEVRLVWDESGDNYKAKQERRKEIQELLCKATNVYTDDEALHVTLSKDLLNLKELEFYVELLD